MEIRVLGPLEVVHDGVPVEVGRAKCRAMLALLVGRVPVGWAPDALAEALWPERDADRARNSLRVHATHLRRALAVGGEVLPRSTGRYALDLPRRAIDVCRFEDRVAVARELAAGGAPAEAVTAFEIAFSKWRGDAYEDVAGVDALRDEITRLTTLRLDAFAEYATALIDEDRPEEAANRLEPIVAANLMREDLAGLLMLALARTGRQRDALAVFGLVKKALGEELGLAPGQTLAAIGERIVMAPDSLDRRAVDRRRPRVHRTVQLVGRTREWATLESAWHRALEGRPQLAVITGESGVGKSALVGAFAARMRTRGATVLVGTCTAAPTEIYQPFPTLVRDLLGVAPPTTSPPHALGELARLAPELTADLPPTADTTDATAGRLRLFDAVASLLAVPDTPRVLVVDDLHWAMADAVALLRHVVRAADGQIMVIVTAHPPRSDRTPFDRARASGRLSRPDVELELGGLDIHGVRALVETLAPTVARPQLLEELDAIRTMTEGHPLRILELVRYREHDPETPIEEIASEDTRALVRQRLRGVDEETRRILRLAAVLGREFTLDRLARAADRDEDATLDAIEIGVEEAFLTECDRPGCFTFPHTMVRNALYYSMTATRRARLHLRCATVMEDEGSDADLTELARHLLGAGDLAERETTFRLTRRVADAAAARFAHAEAVEWYDWALRVGSPDPVTTARLRLDRAVEIELTGSLDEARAEYFAVIETALELGDETLLAGAIQNAMPGTAVLDPGFSQRFGALMERSLELFARDDPRRILAVRGSFLARYYFDASDLGEQIAECERLAGLTDEPSLLHASLAAAMLYREGGNESLLDDARSLLEYSKRHHLAIAAVKDERRLLNELLRAGMTQEFDQRLADFRRAALDTAIPLHRYWAEAMVATRAMMRCADAETEELIGAAALLGRRLEIEEADGLQLLQLFALRYQQGRARETTHGLENVPATSPPILAGTALLALNLADAGHGDAARAMLDRVVDDDGVHLSRNNFRPGAVGLFAGVAAHVGTSRQRQWLRDALLPIADQFVVFGTGGAVFGTGHHWLAELARAEGDVDASAEHLTRSVALCQNADAPYWERRARDALERH